MFLQTQFCVSVRYTVEFVSSAECCHLDRFSMSHMGWKVFCKNVVQLYITSHAITPTSFQEMGTSKEKSSHLLQLVVCIWLGHVGRKGLKLKTIIGLLRKWKKHHWVSRDNDRKHCGLPLMINSIKINWYFLGKLSTWIIL